MIRAAQTVDGGGGVECSGSGLDGATLIESIVELLDLKILY